MRFRSRGAPSVQEADLGRRRTLISFGFLERLSSSPGKLVKAADQRCAYPGRRCVDLGRRCVDSGRGCVDLGKPEETSPAMPLLEKGKVQSVSVQTRKASHGASAWQQPSVTTAVPAQRWPGCLSQRRSPGIPGDPHSNQDGCLREHSTNVR